MENITFKDLDLSDEILKAIDELKFEKATEIQSKAIPIMKSGIDLMGLSQTGSGKTLAFAIPIIENIPLARLIYKEVDIDQEIPEEMYKAVAEVLVAVYKIKNKYK